MSELEGRVEAVDGLPSQTLAEMYALYEQYYGGTSEELFLEDLSDKQYVVFLRDQEQSLQGFSSVKFWQEDFAGQRIRVVYSGDTIVHQDHWGQQVLAFTWIDLAGALKAEAPEVPLYWFLLVKGHRTYRYLTTFSRIFYPAATRTTPPEVKALMDHLASRKFGDFYNHETGVVHFPRSRGHLKADWAAIPKKDARRPDVRFFLERNPGYRQGDELVCLTELSGDNQQSLAARVFAVGFARGLPATLRR